MMLSILMVDRPPIPLHSQPTIPEKLRPEDRPKIGVVVESHVHAIPQGLDLCPTIFVRTRTTTMSNDQKRLVVPFKRKFKPRLSVVVSAPVGAHAP